VTLLMASDLAGYAGSSTTMAIAIRRAVEAAGVR
jgi:hypothetical protein